MSDISAWSSTPGSNNAASPDGFPEGMAPSGVNNSAREVMASVRDYYAAPEWRVFGKHTSQTPAGDEHTVAYASATTFTTAAGDGDTTAIYHANRRVRAVGTTTTTIYGTIQSSSHAAQTTVTVTWDSGTFANDTDLVISLGLSIVGSAVACTALDMIDEDTMASNTDTRAPTQQSVKAYVDSSVSGIIFDSGDVILIQTSDDAAPTGWTKLTSTAYNNAAVRVVENPGTGNTGGNNFTTAFNSAVTTGTPNEGDQNCNVGAVSVARQLHAHNFNLNVNYCDLMAIQKD